VIAIDHIRDALARRPAKVVDDPARPRAAVAVVLRDAPGGPELLLIERARHPEDPWSGHMAFPGGRVDPGDSHAQAAAERETLEEVGLSLADAELLGRIDDIEGRHAGRPLSLVISAHVYHCAAPGALTLNHEVESALWVPLERFVDPSFHVEYPTPYGGYPGILVGEPERSEGGEEARGRVEDEPPRYIVWGLTYRFLEIFLAVLDRPLPERWVRSR
jgi:8-oxo-dGTP pyrophosphatase MutT (NUDIX family)